jgi:hypothetical protein
MPSKKISKRPKPTQKRAKRSKGAASRGKQDVMARRYAKLVAQAWADPSFRERLMSNAAVVLREAGFDVPKSKEVKILETDNEAFYFVLPTKPADLFSDSKLESRMANAYSSSCGACFPFCLFSYVNR